MRRNLNTFLSVLLFLLAGEAAWAQTLTRGPYLQVGTPTSGIVRWRTSTGAESVVRYGTDLSNPSLWSTASQTGTRTEHEVKLTDLVPNTRYYYSIGYGSTVLAQGADFNFWTAPPTGTDQPVRIWVIGDSGTANADARAVRDAFVNFNGSRRVDLWLMLGDNAYNEGHDHQYQQAVFDTYPQLLRKYFVWSTLGNHETYNGQNPYPYFKIFTLPTSAEAGGIASGTEYYYSFDYANIHFLCLDSMISDRRAGSAMLNWMVSDLENNTQDWLVAFWHHPPYTKGSHDSDKEYELIQMRENILPILEDYGVDLVLSGHSHSYERSYFLDGHYGSSGTLRSWMIKNPNSGRTNEFGAYVKKESGPVPKQGAVYAVAGSSGKISGGALNHPAMFISLNRLGSMVLDVNGNQLDARFLDEKGATLDYFTIVKGDGSAPGAYRLRIRQQGNKKIITWPAAAVGYVLETTSSVPASSWSTVPITPVLDGDQMKVEDTDSRNLKFYRLKK